MTEKRMKEFGNVVGLDLVTPIVAKSSNLTINLTSADQYASSMLDTTLQLDEFTGTLVMTHRPIYGEEDIDVDFSVKVDGVEVTRVSPYQTKTVEATNATIDIRAI